jgi:nicotinamide riboside transporter PnuC
MQWKWIGWLGAGMVIFGYYLNANEYIASWLVWMVGNIMVGIYSLYKKAYSTAAMSFMITMMNIYGYIRWLT